MVFMVQVAGLVRPRTVVQDGRSVIRIWAALPPTRVWAQLPTLPPDSPAGAPVLGAPVPAGPPRGAPVLGDPLPGSPAVTEPTWPGGPPGLPSKFACPNDDPLVTALPAHGP